MPTNFKGKSFREWVSLNPGEKCSFARHLKRGTAARSFWGRIQFFKSVKSDGFFYGGITELCSGVRKFNKKGEVVGCYGKSILEKLLFFFLELGWISDQFKNEDQHGKVGFMVARQDLHDALCRREAGGCQYVGWDNLPPAIELGKHYPDSMVFATENLKGTDAGTDKKSKGTEPGTDKIEKGYGAGYGSETTHLHENATEAALAKTEVSRNAPAVIVISQSLEAINQSAKEGSQGEPEESQNLKAGSISLSMTDQNQKQTTSAMPRRMPTILDHFGYTVTIDDISDGEIDQAKLDRYGLRDQMKGMRECCQAVKDSMDRLPYLGRKTNGDIMAKAMVLWTEKNHGRVDKYWYRVAKTLRQGGPSVLKPETEWQAPALSSVYINAADNTGVDLAPFENVLNISGVESYRDGWKHLVGLCGHGELPEPLQKLRDWLWENDAMPDKPAAPPWN
jgi:hypothetical protein